MRNKKKILNLLLEFASLPEKSRKSFLMEMNEYLMMSHVQRRHAIYEWEQEVRMRDGAANQPSR
ncbi:hypothetical protein [Burkholderia stagnalis]|uniref:Uncharacterized protein n=1 Tax=Burkholderia stagnalis TaxID=1503054 RepID=A0ABX9YHU1_9BURK|nr:hypothetical protein [Burkholderia stagnalis]MDY7804750.1 hypothetical protein [Burkholderia stagnalis]RQQ55876.1 hypothetical protein DF158_25730 [Burkholderia stagnalis]RQQ63961.1 hypothetical protein DF137_25185 [Burkholderia stagnalis]RQQ65174.1 hypothetical protein DF139_24380 [Burkholderia stagnalis]RQQ77440.1 hypothetical protein DF138_24480 [Burkholderia stagnalis]